jgi:hypothetical protein
LEAVIPVNEIRLAPGAPNFSLDFEKLLKRGRIKSTPEARADLDAELRLAWLFYAAERKRTSQAPPEDIKQLKNSITKTQKLLRQFEKFGHTNDIACHFCPVGEGTVSVATVHEMKFGGTLELPRNPPPLGGLPERIPPETMMVAINIHRLLDRLKLEIDHTHQRKKKPYGQFRRGNQIVIAHAARFFRRHSSVEATSHCDGPFFKFCKLFFEAITRSSLPSDHALDTRIKAEWKKPTFCSDNECGFGTLPGAIRNKAQASTRYFRNFNTAKN